MPRHAFDQWHAWLQRLPVGVATTFSTYITQDVTGVGSPQAQLDSAKLTPPFQRAMLVDGMRFRIEAAGKSANAPYAQAVDEALSARVRVSCGSFGLTDDFAVVSGLAVRQQYHQGEFTGMSGVLGVTTGGADGNCGSYTWLFDEPLFIPAGIGLRVTARREIDARDDSVFAGVETGLGNFIVSAFGRYFNEDVKVPRGMIVPIPYGLTFADVTVPAVGNLVTQQIADTETSLVNRTGTDFHATRLIGRLPTRDVVLHQEDTIGENTGPETTVRISRTYATRTAEGSRGNFGLTSNRDVVAPAKPFNAVFDIQSRALELNGMLVPPGAGLRVIVFKTTSRNGQIANTRVFPVVGMTGSREEKWPA